MNDVQAPLTEVMLYGTPISKLRLWEVKLRRTEEERHGGYL